MRFLLGWLFLTVLLMTHAGPAAANSYIYSYVDEKGVLHLTNAPVDARYKPTRYRTTPRPTASEVSGNYAAMINTAARRFQMDPHLIKAVIKVESDFKNQAVSHKGAQGLMQLMPGTVRDMGVRSVYDPHDNIMGGTRYLKMLYEQFNGDLELALAAYNAGPARVAEAGGIPRIPETVNYVKKVLRYYKIYSSSGT